MVSSIIGRGGTALSSGYAASKHALRGYFHSLAAEEFPWLRVDVACPGATDTPMWTALPDTAKHEEEKRQNGYQKMAVSRCAELILTTAVGPHWLFYETWIADRECLFWVYMSAYTPNLFHYTTSIFGQLRYMAWLQDGSDIVALPDFFRQFMRLLRK